MARPKRPPEDKLPVYPASPAYKQWVWEEMRRREWTQQRLVNEMKRADRSLSGGKITAKSSTGWLTGFLGAEDADRRYWTNSEFVPALNKALGIAPPSICTPDSPLSQLVDRINHLWRTMDAVKREKFLRAMESTFGFVE